MSEPVPASAVLDTGKSSAIAVYVLYLLSLPSAGVLVLVGLVWAYIARDEAAGWVRTHFDQQIRICWVFIGGMVAAAVLAFIGVLLLIALVGLPILIVAGLTFLVVSIWFYLKSVLGLIALAGNKPA